MILELGLIIIIIFDYLLLEFNDVSLVTIILYI